MSFNWLDLFLSLLTYVIIIGSSFYYFRSKDNGSSGSDGEGGIAFPIDPELDLPPGVSLPEDPASTPRQPAPAEILS